MRTPKRRLSPEEVEGELARLRIALELSDLQLAEVREKVEAAEASGAAEHTAIIDMHRMMLKDEMLVHEVQRLVREERLNAEWAVKRATRKIKSAFHEQADEYFKERRADVDFVGERLIKNLLGQEPDVEEPPPEGVMVVARDLSPADTALLLHERKVAAFVTDAGAKTSHTAIVARALEVPAVVGVGRVTSCAERGRLDRGGRRARRGGHQPHPGGAGRLRGRAARATWRASAALLATRELPARTLDGVRVRLAGNIEFAEEVPSLLAHGGEAVGLYRTEFLFMGRGDLPSEEEHYRELPRGSSRRSRRARSPSAPSTSAGTSCRPACAVAAENPALGLRAIRYCLRQPQLFRPQLRALLRASVHGDLRIMFPHDLGGRRAARGAPARSRRSGRSCGRRASPVRDVPVGIMVELPSAAHAGRPAGRRSATSSPSAPTTSSSTPSASTGRTRTSPTCTGRCTSRCCGC